MDFERDILNFNPSNNQESNDKKIIVTFVQQFREDVLLRNEIAHITSSGFIMNPALDKVLLIHHNIRNTWAWTGGHADGDSNLLRVALREAQEETGVSAIAPLHTDIASIDILPVFGHERKGVYVSAHLHLSVAYLLVCEELQHTRIKADENSGVTWFDVEQFTLDFFDPSDVYLYGKLIKRAREH